MVEKKNDGQVLEKLLELSHNTDSNLVSPLICEYIELTDGYGFPQEDVLKAMEKKYNGKNR